jgi:xylulokinase
VAFGLRDSFELIKTAGKVTVEQVRVSGGGAKSPLWRQILADVLNAEMVTVNTTEGAAYGAALLAGVGGGAWGDVDSACQRTIHLTGTTAPSGQAALYDDAYARYRALYPALAPIFHQTPA